MHTSPRIVFLNRQFTAPTPLTFTHKRDLIDSMYSRLGLLAALGPFDSTFVPDYGGLYAIMVYDAACKPLPYRLIYMGEAGSLAERVCRSHEKYESWERAANASQLYVAFAPIAGKLPRKMAERSIIEHYSPECNEKFNQKTLWHPSLAMRRLSDLR